jgi:predicted CXXCH cytochrome family protein
MLRKTCMLMAALLLISLPLLGQDGDKAQILTTAHDLVGSGEVTGAVNADASTFTQVCVFCHTPHGFEDTNKRDGTLLWNHQVTAGLTYTPYTSPSMKTAAVGMSSNDFASSSTPEEFYSLACLSCHDGQTAINAVYRIPMAIDDATPANTQIGSGYSIGDGTDPDGQTRLIGTDLSNDHPVNVNYATALTNGDTGLWDINAGGASTVWSSGGGDSITSVRAYTAVGGSGEQVPEPILFNNTVQCASCHNPHNATNDAFLRVSLEPTSLLCLKCHSTGSY